MILLDQKTRARLEAIVRRAKAGGGLESLTRNRGTAEAPKLAESAIAGMWLFLGVAVDPAGLRPQEVRLLELDLEGQTWHALFTEYHGKIVAASTEGEQALMSEAAELRIVIEWSAEEADGR